LKVPGSHEATYGFVTALLAAGVGAVISTYWLLPDAPAATIAVEFYRQWWRTNFASAAPLENPKPRITAAEGLRRAQVLLYKAGEPVHYWANHFVSGYGFA